MQDLGARRVGQGSEELRQRHISGVVVQWRTSAGLVQVGMAAERRRARVYQRIREHPSIPPHENDLALTKSYHISTLAYSSDDRMRVREQLKSPPGPRRAPRSDRGRRVAGPGARSPPLAPA